jgi:hypothetical protein
MPDKMAAALLSGAFPPRGVAVLKRPDYYGKTTYAAEIEGDLRAAFYVEGDVIFTVDIGSHAIYRV